MRILVIDDSRERLSMATRATRANHWNVLVARSGRRGIAAAQVLDPDAVLVAESLDDMDGFELCRRLRLKENSASIPVVMVVSLEDSNVRRRGFRVGANAMLVLPYDAPALARAVAKGLEWRAGLAQQQVRHEVELELDSNTDYLMEVNDFVDELCRPTPLEEAQVMHLRQAFLEIAANAIEWGNGSNLDKHVLVRFRAYNDRVEVEVRDQGKGFDPTNLRHAATQDDPLAHMEVRNRMGLREGGFGLLIARGLVDELRYSNGGSTVKLITHFDRTRSHGLDARALGEDRKGGEGERVDG